DSKLDWQIESDKMSAIYRAGIITLLATSARNSQEGCGAIKAKFLPVKRF
ncbi:hypothetical protein BDW02DRAFT_513331, partial [Decorospora gaudefroyi]